MLKPLAKKFEQHHIFVHYNPSGITEVHICADGNFDPAYGREIVDPHVQEIYERMIMVFEDYHDSILMLDQRKTEDDECGGVVVWDKALPAELAITNRATKKIYENSNPSSSGN